MSKALLISLYPLNQLGGGERYTLEAFRSVNRSGDPCLGYALEQGFPGNMPLEQRLCQQFRRFDGGGIVDEPSVSFRQLLSQTAEWEVIWIHQYLSNMMIFDILGNIASDQLTILTSHGHEVEVSAFGSCFQPCRNVSIIEVSEYSALRSSAYGARTWGVSGGVWKQDIATSSTGTKKAGQICSVGRILPHKGVEITLAGAPDGSNLHIIGSRKLDATYAKYLLKVPTKAQVYFLDDVNDASKQKVIRESEVLVASSTETLYDGRTIAQAELLGLVLLEAIALGTLPVVSDVPSFVEVMRTLGLKQFVYPQRAAHRLEEILSEVLAMGCIDRQQIVAAAQKELEKSYLWDDYWLRVKKRVGINPAASSARA